MEGFLIDMGNFINAIGFVMIAIWFLLFIQSHRMFYLFRKKYPQIAKKRISNAFKPYLDPAKIIFFFKKESIPLLKDDKEIWNLRRQTKILFFLSLGIPLAMVLVIILFIKQQIG